VQKLGKCNSVLLNKLRSAYTPVEKSRDGFLVRLICILDVSGLNLATLTFTMTENFGTFYQSVKENSSIMCQILRQI
jgi:hypothetical protein